MNKVIRTLEFDKILDRLAQHASFSAGMALARDLRPETDLETVQRRLAETAEARCLLEMIPGVGVGGARDIRAAAARAARGVLLQPPDLLDVQATLLAARRLRRTVLQGDVQFDLLGEIAQNIVELPDLVSAIDSALDDQGMVLDSASPKLARLRREMRIVRDRIQDKLQRILNSQAAQYLQEPIVSQRGGRWVIPLQSNFKGRVRGIVHDQSASGATLWIEPMATVELNNQLREATVQEEQEVQRILAELSALVGEEADRIRWTVEVLAELDLALAKAKYAELMEAIEPEFLPFQPNKKGRPEMQGSARHPGSTIQLMQARHPLLDPDTVVPIDVELDDETYVVIITGPNTGGKTVSLKTVGLMALMAQSGLHLPCTEAKLCVFQQVFADIGDEQSIEQSLSTFSGHLVNVVEILDQTDDHSLVILDELGAGTDPAEGSALARSILTYLRDKGATTFVATHYPELKLYGHNTLGVTNASVEFDLETLAPTYRLRIGLAGRSNAFAIAGRLGLDQEIIESARALIPETELQAGSLLDSIYRAKDEAESEAVAAYQSRRQVDDLRDNLDERLRRIDLERLRVMQEARIQAQVEMDEFREELRQLRRQLSAAGQPLTDIRQLQQQAAHMAKQMEQEAEPLPAVEIPDDGAERILQVGDAVWVTTLKVEGVVMAISRDQAEIQIGRLHTRADLDELEWRQSKPEPKPERELPKSAAKVSASARVELDLRGQRVEGALQELDSFLDTALLANVPWVRIIHGKGTGALRTAVRQALKDHPQIARFEDGKDGEGGWGVTVAHLS